MFTVNPPRALSALLAALLALALFINGVAMMGGADRVARFIVGVMAKGGAGVDFEFVMVNGAPGWVLSRDGAPFAVAAIETDGEKVRKVFATLNPDKLAHVRPSQGASG